jgi:hypothetical protein
VDKASHACCLQVLKVRVGCINRLFHVNITRLDIVRFMYFHNLIPPPFFWSRYEQEAHGISYSSKLAIQNEQKTNVPSNCSVKDRDIIIALNKKAKKMQFLIEKIIMYHAY